MITVHVRKQGGAAIITIPSDVLRLLDIKVGTELELAITKEGFVAHPIHNAKRKRYTLTELLHGTTRKVAKELKSKTEWARKGKSVGRELT